MTESSRSSTHGAEDANVAPGSAEGLLTALRHAAADPGTRETLNELGARARSIVEELSRSARAARENSAATPAPEAAATRRTGHASPEQSAAPLPALHRRLDELRACVDEVADVLGATVERLETVELQLGDPDAGIERQLADGIERCERVLMGIDHRVLRLGGGVTPAAPAVEASPDGDLSGAVLVVCASSRRRAALCVALERQGLQTLAATDLAQALGRAAALQPAAALVVLDGTDQDRSRMLHQWKECRERGNLPSAAVLGRADSARAASFGCGSIHEEHGAAAMAASLLALARAGAEAATESGPAVVQAIAEETESDSAQGARTTP